VSHAETDDLRVLVLTPAGRDAELLWHALADAGIAAEPCAEVDDFCERFTQGAGAGVIAEEALTSSALERIAAIVNAQSPWSDLPLIVLTSTPGGEIGPRRHLDLDRLGNVSLLERPVRVLTLVSTIQAALRARRRQYEVRDHLLQQMRAEEERERLREAALRARIHGETVGAALRESEESFRVLADALPQIVWAARSDGQLDYCNRRWSEYTGLGVQQSTSRDVWTAALHPQEREQYLRRWDESVRTGEIFEAEHRFRRARDGTYRWHLVRALPLRDLANRVIRWFGTCTDIDDHRRAEETIRETSQTLQALINSSPLAILVVDLDGIVKRWNTGAERIFGWKEEEVVGRPVPIVPPEYEEEFRSNMAWLARGDMFSGRELRRRKKDGEALDIALWTAPLHDATGRVRDVLCVLADITERKHAERELERAKNAAEAANSAKDEFLAVVSHELRSPLTAILMWAQMLRTGRLDEAKTVHALETIERSTKMQVQIVEDLLDISRIVAGKLRLEPRPVGLHGVLDAALSVVRPMAETKGVTLESRLDASGVVMGDPDRLQQVVWNLLSNAIKFTPAGGRVTLTLERIGESVQITVSDTGCGISGDFLPYVFDRFRQAEGGSTRSHGGLGIGLAIVRHLVELHGGSVHVESPGLGRGAVFTVRLPIAPLPVQVAVRRLVEQPPPVGQEASAPQNGQHSAPPTSTQPSTHRIE
jgi:PAS domain S-box-containing protein